MQTSGLPTRIAVPFADAGTKNTIPVASQIGITGGAASFTTGFPPLTMTPVSAGGIPPFGADFNGILNAITNAIRWNVAGSGYPFDSTFATAVTGYPKGALLPASDFSGYWLNTQEANTTTPENSTSATTGWVPGVHYGATALTGLSSSSVTLTTLQAAKPRITLAGTLTANINLVFPAWVRSWTVVNNCTGDFSVTCKTPAGTGVTIPAGLTAVINGDGTNITQDSNLFGTQGRLLNVQYFTASGTYTPTAGTSSIVVELLGGGGAGGGIPTAPSAGTAGGGGGGGGYGRKRITSGFSGVTVTVGIGGTGVVNGAGGAGGASSFGALMTAGGGGGGGVGSTTTSSAIPVGAQGAGGTTTLADVSRNGGSGGTGLISSTFAQGGIGGDTAYAPQTRSNTIIATAVSSGNGASANTGAGGTSALGLNSGTGASGGNGGSGLCIVWEYA